MNESEKEQAIEVLTEQVARLNARCDVLALFVEALATRHGKSPRYVQEALEKAFDEALQLRQAEQSAMYPYPWGTKHDVRPSFYHGLAHHLKNVDLES